MLSREPAKRPLANGSSRDRAGSRMESILHPGAYFVWLFKRAPIILT